MGQAKSKGSSRYSLLSEHEQNFILDRLDESDTSEDELFAINPQHSKTPQVSSERWYVTLAQIFFPFRSFFFMFEYGHKSGGNDERHGPEIQKVF